MSETKIPCRDYDPPGLWCPSCSAGFPSLCTDPMTKSRPESRTYQSSDGLRWKPAEPIGWKEEHGWLARLIYMVLGTAHCGKSGGELRRGFWRGFTHPFGRVQ